MLACPVLWMSHQKSQTTSILLTSSFPCAPHPHVFFLKLFQRYLSGLPSSTHSARHLTVNFSKTAMFNRSHSLLKSLSTVPRFRFLNPVLNNPSLMFPACFSDFTTCFSATKKFTHFPQICSPIFPLCLCAPLAEISFFNSIHFVKV